MAGTTVTKSVAYNGTTTAASVDYVCLTNPNATATVLNRDSTNGLWVTFDGVTVPTVGGDNCYFVPAGAALTRRCNQQGDSPKHVFNPSGIGSNQTGSIMVMLIPAAGTPAYSVEILPL